VHLTEQSVRLSEITLSQKPTPSLYEAIDQIKNPDMKIAISSNPTMKHIMTQSVGLRDVVALSFGIKMVNSSDIVVLLVKTSVIEIIMRISIILLMQYLF
jgi:hypothetical protein